MTDQETPDGIQERPEGGSVTPAPPEGWNGPQTGTEGFDGTADLQRQVEAWRHKAIRRALRISKLEGTIQAVTELASEEITARTEWGDGYRAAITDLQEVLREFGHLSATVPASSGEWLRAGTRDLSISAHDAGPSIREAAAADRRWWDGEKAGEQ